MSALRLVVGLGNPGSRYAGTRHNLGFMLVDRFAQHRGLRFRRDRFGLSARFDGVYLFKPQTFMNLAGEAVGPFARWLKADPGAVFVVSDDLDLPLGAIRIRREGSSGGHNGLKSVAEHLGTTAFPRLRIGIGRPPVRDYAVIDWVLGRFTAAERNIVEEALGRAEEALQVAIREGIGAAMNRYNG